MDQQCEVADVTPSVYFRDLWFSYANCGNMWHGDLLHKSATVPVGTKLKVQLGEDDRADARLYDLSYTPVPVAALPMTETTDLELSQMGEFDVQVSSPCGSC